jgi:hypothetical protein
MNTQHTTQNETVGGGIKAGLLTEFKFWPANSAQQTTIGGVGAEFSHLMTHVVKTIPAGNGIYAAEVSKYLELAYLCAIQGIVKPVGN